MVVDRSIGPFYDELRFPRISKIVIFEISTTVAGAGDTSTINPHCCQFGGAAWRSRSFGTVRHQRLLSSNSQLRQFYRSRSFAGWTDFLTPMVTSA